METTKNTGSYFPPTVNPTVQKPSDGNTQKRSSYRRPVEAQPIGSAPAESTLSSTNPSNTARPVAAASSNEVSRASSNRRRQSAQIPPPTTGAMSETVPAAPDVPRAPPMSYRDPYAKSRGPQRAGSTRSRDPPIQLNQSRHQATVQTAATRMYGLRSPPYAPAEPLAGVVGPPNSQRTSSVPDRSPLQKLEGKLDDISKEERRARILEAELAAQEKAEAEMRARRAREAAAREQRVVSQPGAKPEKTSNIPNRALGSRRHVSAPIRDQQKSPMPSDVVSEDDYTYEETESWNPSAQAGRAAPASQRETTRKDSRVSSSYQQVPHTDAVIPRTASLKGKEPVGVARGAGSFRDRSNTSLSQSVHRKAAPDIAGLGLLGVDEKPHEAEVSRNESRKNQGKRDSRGIAAAQMEMQQQAIDNKGVLRATSSRHLDPNDSPSTAAKRKSVGFSEPDTELQHQASYESRSQSRFDHHDQPERLYTPGISLQEWKTAQTGALVADDLDLDAPVTRTSGNKAWWEESQAARRRRSNGYTQPTYDGYADESPLPTAFNPPLLLKCGPLLRYTGMRIDRNSPGKDKEIWRGSVMIVTTDASSTYTKPPTLRLFKQPMDLLPPPPQEVDGDQLDPSYVDPVEGQTKISRIGKTLYVKPIDEIAENEDLSRLEDESGLFSQRRSLNGSGSKSSRIHKKDGEKLGKFRDIPGVRLHAERGVTFWRFNLEVELGSSQTRIAYKINQGPAVGFWVPARGESMNIMFHSCNGFSATVDSSEFCGPDPLWRDVLNSHQTRPFHVMIGGGDQIYNDAAMRETVLFKQWTESRNPHHKHHTPFSAEMQDELEQFYLDRYAMWFSQGMFGMANSQIPMVNIWDDHDIIDGFGSYPHHFMQTPVFTGIGAVAFKYYMLFQHQSVPAETEATEPSWVLGKSPGPYIKERSRSVFMQLGRQVAFLGLDCRTERQRDEILTEDSYDVIFDRLEDEIIKGETKHLIVLLGVPIAYPRLNFLEAVLTSRLMDPLKALGRAGLLGNFVNKFDGGVEILDDLDDHWTAKHHKEERNWFIRELQHIASTKSVRVTILGGDVHLGAIGQFYTNKKLNVPKDRDHRYMPNIISSAIVNTPPPDMMADIINKRNKVHHLDHFTDEDMIPIFSHDVDGKKRNNTHLLPRRNWCSIREYKPGTTPPSTPSPPATSSSGPGLARRLSESGPGNLVRRMSGNQNRPSARRRGPPLSYHNNPAYADADYDQVSDRHQPQSSFSPDRSEPERPARSRRNSLSSLFRRRPSTSHRRSESPHSRSTSLPGDRAMSQERPSNFHRRPSVLSKKGIRAHGEFINLEGGLDVSLNMEVSQHDPAGITTPYRLLIPALNYTESEAGVVEKDRNKRRGLFAAFGGGRNKNKIGDDGYSISGSESGSELGEVSEDDEEQRTQQRYKVGPRILLPGLGSKNKRATAPLQSASEKRLSSGYHTNATAPLTAEEVYDSGDHAASQTRGRRQSMDVPQSTGRRQTRDVDAGTSSRRESVAGKRHVSAPQHAVSTASTTVPTTTIPSHTASTRKQPTYNSSHKSQFPSPASETDPEPKVQRRSMGGILNQHSHDKKWEYDAHVLAHTPSQKRSKRDSYPPHPAIVGAGPESPYSRDGPVRLQARNDTSGGDYFSSGPRTNSRSVSMPKPVAPAKNDGIEPEYAVKPVQRADYASRGGYDRTAAYPSYPSRAGVGAKYLGNGRYEDDDDSYDSAEEDDDRTMTVKGREMSQDSFVIPKKKKKWQIWR